MSIIKIGGIVMCSLNAKDEKELYFRLETAREKYKPEKIKLLFVAEAPPNKTERFFYYKDVREADYLYLGIMKALSEKCCMMPTKQLRQIKGEALLLLKQCGIFLMDLCSMPLAYANPPIAELHKNDFMKRLEQMDGVVKDSTNIILIKTNVYDCLFKDLKQKGYNVVDKRIPFPACGQQKMFQDLIHEALSEINFLSE